MRTRIFTLLVAFLAIAGNAVWGQESTTDVWDGTRDETWASDYATQTTFEITTAEQLAQLAYLVDNSTTSKLYDFHDKTVILKADIVLNEDCDNYMEWGNSAPEGLNAWNPIGKATPVGVFQGTFDGNGHTISGMYIPLDETETGIYAQQKKGLFSVVQRGTTNTSSNGIIKNLTIEKSYVEGKQDVGAICGSCTGEIINCTNKGMVVGTRNNIGGIVGSGSATKCCNEGLVISEGKNVGGIVGNLRNDYEISDCYNTGSIEGSECVGGIAGFVGFRTNIERCYNTGLIEGEKACGGISGDYSTLVSSSYPAYIKSCFNMGLVKGNENVGAISGTKEDGLYIEECAYLEGTAEQGSGIEDESIDIKTASELATLITSALSSENGWSGDDASYTTTDTYTHTLKLPTFTTGNYVEVPIYEVHLENASEAITSSLKQGTVKDGICTFTKNNDEEITITQQPANSPFTEWESGVAFSMPANDLVVSVKEKEYTITIKEPYDEQISSSHEKATEGTTITLSPIEEGKEIKDFIISYEKDGAITEETISGNTFEMPASDVEIISVTFVEPEQPGDDDEENQGNTGIHKPQRPIKYYNIYIDTICPGLNVEVSKDVVQEGHQVSAYLTIQAECDTTGMRFEYKRGLFGYWKDLKELEGVQPGEYIIKNIYTDIYIRALDATLPEEEPTGIDEVEGAKAYAKEGSIYVYTPNREEVTIISMSGAIIKHEEHVGLQSYSVSRGIYIVRIGDKVFKLKN